MTINTIIEKINELKKNYIEVIIENEAFNPEEVIEITLTYDEDAKSIVDKLVTGLTEMAVEVRTYFNNFSFIFECEDGNDYEIDLFLVEREFIEEDECIGNTKEPWSWVR